MLAPIDLPVGADPQGGDCSRGAQPAGGRYPTVGRAGTHLARDNVRLDPSAMIARKPALEIRRLLRRTHGVGFDAQTVREVLGISRREAETVIGQLEEAELVAKKMAAGLDDKRPPDWANTVKGNAVAMATTARPVKRTTADRALAQFLDRVATVNATGALAYRVSRVVVFGSYLTQANELNDVDLLIDLVPRNPNPREQEVLEESVLARAVKNGRRFGNIVEVLAWPQTEVRLLLKKRSRTLSLHYEDHALVEKTGHHVIFEDRGTSEPNQRGGTDA